MQCQCEAEHGGAVECRNEAATTCPLCKLEVCLDCMQGDESQPCCTVCSDESHVTELPECMEAGHSHRATWMVAISTSSPVVRIHVCPAERAVYEAQGYHAARLIREVSA